MAANYECHRNRIGVEFTTATRPTLRRHNHINFTFRFKKTVYVYLLQNPNSTSPPFYHGEENSPVTTAGTAVTISGATPDQDMREAVEETLVRVQCLTDAGRQHLTEIAVKAACDEIARIKDEGVVCVDLVFQVLQEHSHVYYDERDLSGSDSSFELKEYEDEDDVITDSCCCVCLEVLEQGELLFCMPCQHVFHQDCIKKWLKTNPSCPLCRFEMPISN